MASRKAQTAANPGGVTIEVHRDEALIHLADAAKAHADALRSHAEALSAIAMAHGISQKKG